MRTILVLAVCVGVLTAVGVIHFRKSGDNIKVDIDTGELKDRTEDLIDAVKDKLSDDEEDRATDRIHERLDDIGDAVKSAEEAGEDFFDHTRKTIHEIRR